MATFKYHDIAGIGDIHIAHDLEYATQALRKAATGLETRHLDRLSKQFDDGSFWRLTQITPSVEWAPFVPPVPVVGDINKVLTVVSDGDGDVKFSWGVGSASITSDDTYNNFGANPADVIIDNAEGQGDLVFKPTGTNSFKVDISGVTNVDTDGFITENGTDYFSILRQATNELNIDANLREVKFTINDANNFDIDLANVGGYGDKGFRIEDTSGPSDDYFRVLKVPAASLKLEAELQFVTINTNSSITLVPGNNFVANIGGDLDFNVSGAIHFDAAVASNLTVSGATADLTLGARGTTLPLNDASNTTLDGSASSITGGINEARLLTNDYTASDTESSTTSAVAQTNSKVTRTIPAGTYVLYWTHATYIESPADYCEVEIYNDTDTSSISVDNIPGVSYKVTSGFTKVTFGASKAITMYYRRIGGTAGQSAYIKNARLMFLEA